MQENVRKEPQQNPGDLHDYWDVAENYDRYVVALPGGDDTSVVDFHLELAQQYGGSGILDIACGTGVTLIPLIQNGYQVTGIDVSEAMLSVTRQKISMLPPIIQQRVNLVCANMKDFRLTKQSSLAIIPRSGFLHLLTSSDQEECFRNIHKHLLPGGVLSFNTFDPSYTLVANNLKGTNPKPQLRVEYINIRNNKERIWNVAEFDPVKQVMEGSWIFEELAENGEIIERRTRPLRMRWSFEPEIRHLLRLCGFEVLIQYSSYTKAPRVYGNIIWVAQKNR
jgi:ubiquinone/menaquinone biosynthesis C-methylase UbiE